MSKGSRKNNCRLWSQLILWLQYWWWNGHSFSFGKGVCVRLLYGPGTLKRGILWSNSGGVLKFVLSEEEVLFLSNSLSCGGCLCLIRGWSQGASYFMLSICLKTSSECYFLYRRFNHSNAFCEGWYFLSVVIHGVSGSMMHPFPLFNYLLNLFIWNACNYIFGRFKETFFVVCWIILIWHLFHLFFHFECCLWLVQQFKIIPCVV